MSERQTYTVEEAAQLVGVSRGVAYESCRRFLSGDTTEIPAIRVGRHRLVVPKARLDALLGLTAATTDSSQENGAAGNGAAKERRFIESLKYPKSKSTR